MSIWDDFEKPEEETQTKKWLCESCGKEYRYLCKISGTESKSCEMCGDFTGSRFLFDIAFPAYEWQTEHFAAL